jgi:DNA-binding GntR family transcriptional regulator
MKELAFESPQFRGIRQEVCQILRKAIFDGLYEPGQQIYEAEIAKKLQLSRGPVREALLQLEKESLILNVFNKGWFVIELTADQITEITSMRVVLEVLALKMARKRVNSRQLKKLVRIQESMLELFQKEDYTDAIQCDFDFHREIWRIAGHGVLEENATRLTTPYFAFLKMSKIRKGFRMESFYEGLENHHAMLDYLAGKTEKSAEWCIRNHFAPLTYRDWRVLLDTIHKEDDE